LSSLYHIPVNFHVAATAAAAELHELKRFWIDRGVGAFLFYLSAMRARVMDVRAVECRRFQWGLLSCPGSLLGRPSLARSRVPSLISPDGGFLIGRRPSGRDISYSARFFIHGAASLRRCRMSFVDGVMA